MHEVHDPEWKGHPTDCKKPRLNQRIHGQALKTVKVHQISADRVITPYAGR